MDKRLQTFLTSYASDYFDFIYALDFSNESFHGGAEAHIIREARADTAWARSRLNETAARLKTDPEVSASLASFKRQRDGGEPRGVAVPLATLPPLPVGEVYDRQLFHDAYKAYAMDNNPGLKNALRDLTSHDEIDRFMYNYTVVSARVTPNTRVAEAVARLLM